VHNTRFWWTLWSLGRLSVWTGEALPLHYTNRCLTYECYLYMVIHRLSFWLTSLFVSVPLQDMLLQVRLVPKCKLFGIVVAELFTGRMPFLSPNQQHQSTEGWQCSWLGTACCHRAVKVGQKHHDSMLPPCCQGGSETSWWLRAWASLPSGLKGASLLWQ